MKYKHLLHFACYVSIFCFVQITSAKQHIQLTAELENPVLKANETQRTIVKVSLLPERIETNGKRPDVNLAIALDRSGSMSGEKIVQARNAALEALSLLGNRDRISVVTYSDEATTLIKSQHPLEPARLASKIRNIQSGGSTALYAGVSQAAAELRRGRSDSSFDRLILLSDGIANKGPSSTSDLSGLSQSLAGEDISVSTVGLGAGFNEDLMTAMTEAAQGNAYFAENSNDLIRIFSAELEDLLNVTATDVQVVIKCAPGIRPIRVIGREGVIEDGTVTFKINQLFGGQEKYALIEIETPLGEDGAQVELLNIQTTYRMSDVAQPIQQSITANARYSKNTQVIADASNVEVTRAVADNRIAEVKREAITLSDKGDNKQAAQIMRDLQVEINQMNAVYDDAELYAEVGELEVEAKELDHSKLSNTKRKSYSNSSYRTFNQQKSID
ncbi:MAG: vWA domain-containing protein [Opitutaceae bacterium]